MPNDSGTIAAILTLGGVLITGLLTVFTAVRTGKDRQERNADRRKIEEETTEVILRRVRKELDRAYETIDLKDEKLREYARWFNTNKSIFAKMGLTVPEVDIDEGPWLRDDMRRVRLEIDNDRDDGDRDDRIDA